jgi:hypothetical protein
VGLSLAGTPNVGAPVIGLPLGDPGVTVGPAVMGAPGMGAPVMCEESLTAGAAEGLPGVTVGPSMAETPIVGVPINGAGTGRSWSHRGTSSGGSSKWGCY